MTRSLLLTVLALLIPAFAGPSSARADSPDDKAIHDFKLTPAVMEKLTAASVKVAAAIKTVPKAERESEGFLEGKTIAEGVKKVEKHPQIAAALKSAGMSPRDFITATMTVMTSSMWSSVIKQSPKEERPPEVNLENVKFVDAHPAEVKKWASTWQKAGGDDAGHGDADE